MVKKGWVILVFLALYLLNSATAAEAVSISPSELTIRNIDERKDYQFILLLESESEGLIDVELRSSHESTVASPDKLMLNEGEQRSVRLHMDPRRLEEGLDSIFIQPRVNGVPSEDRLDILIEDIPANETVPQQDEEMDSSIIQEPAFFTLIIYGLVFIVAILIITIFIPEIRKNIKSAQSKSVEVSDKRFVRRSRKRMKNLGRRLDKADERVKKIIGDVERFHENAHNLIKEKSGGKYGLE